MTKSIAIIPSTDVFEHHFGRGLDLTRREFVETYANDFLFELSYAIALFDWEVTLVIPSAGVRSVEVSESKRSPVKIIFAPVPAIVRRFPLALRRGGVLRWWSSRATTSSKALWEVLDDFDVIYVQEYAFGRFFEALRRVSSRQVLVGAYHGASIEAAPVARLSSAIDRADLLLALTRDEASAVSTAFPSSRVEVVANPVRTDVFRPIDQARSGSIWVGRMVDRHKGITTLFRAAALTSPQLWAPLRLVGDGPDKEHLVTEAARLGIEEHVDFLPFENDRNVLARLLASSKMAVFPSNYEGLPLAALEAQACGTPVVASDISGFRAACDPHSVELVPTGDAEALSRAITRMHQRLDDEGNLTESARGFVCDRFSSEAIGAQLDRLFSDALTRRRESSPDARK